MTPTGDRPHNLPSHLAQLRLVHLRNILVEPVNFQRPIKHQRLVHLRYPTQLVPPSNGQLIRLVEVTPVGRKQYQPDHYRNGHAAHQQRDPEEYKHDRPHDDNQLQRNLTEQTGHERVPGTRHHKVLDHRLALQVVRSLQLPDHYERLHGEGSGGCKWLSKFSLIRRLHQPVPGVAFVC
uniref:(northern house mosquito) hypothetical protein n=1 Tax=Culex pipiens TaxID=7175 RepID=A0A8D8D7Y3_CULPI